MPKMELRDLKDAHKGQRCFIIGTGPSLVNTNMSLLKNEICFGINALYRGFSRWGISCKYYLVSDPRVWVDIYEELLKIDSIFFVSEEIQGTYPDTIDFEKCFLIKSLPGSMWIDKIFSGDLELGKINTDNSGAEALQHAFYMGFDKVYLLGHDCSTGHFQKDKGDDPTMYDKSGGYHAFSDDWRVRFERSFESYRVCKSVYEQKGREIINCSVGGNLDVFKRMSLEEVIEGKEK
jgi:hypothetical protein